MILFADTSSDITKLTLLNIGADSFLDEIAFESRGMQTEILIAKIDELLKNNKSDKAKLELIIAVVGPGSYTGLRIGLATVNAMAYALNIPIVGIKNADDPVKVAKKLSGSKPLRVGSFALPKYLYPPKITKAP